ncbi:MAG: hypothetical protein ACRDMV_16070 [Streptosporangiales bacterium]
MIVDIRPTTRLRGNGRLDVAGSLAPIVAALRDDTIDLSRLRVVCDWIQYKNNFREAIDLRAIGSTVEGAMNGAGAELAIDLRRSGEVSLERAVRELLAQRARSDKLGRVYLEPWTPATSSRIWEFNALYWRFLQVWEQATGRRYEESLPGGESDARNVRAVRELISGLFAVWDDLAVRDALPEELYIVELGVGNGNQARTWLDEFRRMDREHGREYYRRLNYLMCDYSEHVLNTARRAVAHHSTHISSFILDATKPATALGFLRSKVFLVYISNVYDNLPTEEVARIDGQDYGTEVRAYVPHADAGRLARSIGVEPEALYGFVDKLLVLGPELLPEVAPGSFPDVAGATAFWRATWDAVKLEERYVPLMGLDLHPVAPGINGEVLRPLLEADGDVRMHVSNGAVASFSDTLPLLHPYGRLQCHDLFVTDTHQYRTGFRGPGKYDGSIVNWVNGPLLQHVGSRSGFDVCYASFAHRAGTNVVTLITQVRD